MILGYESDRTCDLILVSDGSGGLPNPTICPVGTHYIASAQTERKHCFQQFFQCRGSMFSEPLHSNDSFFWFRYSSFQVSCHTASSALNFFPERRACDAYDSFREYHRNVILVSTSVLTVFCLQSSWIMSRSSSAAPSLGLLVLSGVSLVSCWSVQM